VKTVETAAPKLEVFAYHAESHEQIQAPAERVFGHLDDHTRLAAHMNQRSWRTGWSRMTLSLDEQAGRALGSHIRMEGRVLGVKLSLEEVVTEHTPPARRVWRTVGAPRLLVIGHRSSVIGHRSSVIIGWASSLCPSTIQRSPAYH
jgi:hypothetical protein